VNDNRVDQLKTLLSNTKALLESMRYSAATATGDAANIGKYTSYKMFLRKYNGLVRRAAPLLPDVSPLDAFDVDRLKDSGDYTWVQQKELFDLGYSNAALLKSLLEEAIGYPEDETNSLRDFIEANLRRAIYTTPHRETDVQNSIETLLVGRGMQKGTEYDRETGRVKTSGKESIPDFIFPTLGLCLEVKLVRSAELLKGVIDEVNADIRAYGMNYERQLYVVYDLGVIRDEAEFKRDLEAAAGVSVLIVKH
jgi:DpnII restriction endonuclease